MKVETPNGGKKASEGRQSEQNLGRAGIKHLESGKKNAERAALLPFLPSRAPASFQFPFSLPFSRRFNTGGASAEERYVR